MTTQEKYVKNKGVNIHYVLSDDGKNSELTPMLICPGLSESAIEYEKVMKDLQPRKTATISFRGRFKSDAPLSGYGLNEHISDIDRVVEEVRWNEMYLLGYSRGVSYALGYALNNKEKIKGLILIDYPAEHKEMPKGWAEDFLRNYEEYFGSKADIASKAIQGIEVESKHYAFWDDLNSFEFPVLIMKGNQEGSALTQDHIIKYKQNMKILNIVHFKNSGHDLRKSEYEKYIKTIREYLL
ncbi:hypothetical protein PMSD_06235 [Paenibacillus macquariensis subsp. defensor]|nr:hypothetical protein PMSD_06235 [Paenibacillus macquariensis subsp. defensor]